MMDWQTLVIHWFEYSGGIILAGAMAAALLAGFLLGVLWLFWHLPRIHFGAPKNPCEFHAYHNGSIINQYEISWWFGFSSRNRASWWIGVMRFRDTRDA